MSPLGATHPPIAKHRKKTMVLRCLLLLLQAWRLPLFPNSCSSLCIHHHHFLTESRIVPILPVQLSTHLELQLCKSNGIISGKSLFCLHCVRILSLTVLEMFAPTKGRVVGGGMASSQYGPDCSNRAVRSQADSSFNTSATAASTGSDGSASTGSFTSSGQSLSQSNRSHATVHPTTPSRRGQVNVQPTQATKLVRLPAPTNVSISIS
jgi:hypothetical protein